MTADIPFAVPAYATVHRNIIPLRSIQRMRSFADWAIGYRGPPPDGQGEPDWSVNLRTLTLQGLIGSPETLLKEVWSTAIPKICREVLGPDIAYSIDTSLVRDYKPDHRPGPANMHFDAHIFGPQSPMVTVWIPLNDVGKDAPGLTIAKHPHWPASYWSQLAAAVDGTGKYVRGAHLRRSYPHDEIFALARDEPEWPFVEPQMDAGDVIVFDHQHIHGTQIGLENPGRRRSLEIRVLPVPVVKQLLSDGSKNYFVQLAQ